MQPLKYSTQRDRWKQGYGACPDAWSKADSLVPSASLRCWGKSRRSGFCSGNSDAQGQQTQPDVACGAGQALVSGSAETTGRTSALCCAVVGRSGYCSGNTDGGERDVVCPAPRRLLSGGDKRKRKGESPGAAVSVETCCTVPRRAASGSSSSAAAAGRLAEAEVPEDADDDAPECETAAREVVDEPGEEPGEQERGEDYPDDDDAEG